MSEKNEGVGSADQGVAQAILLASGGISALAISLLADAASGGVLESIRFAGICGMTSFAMACIMRYLLVDVPLTVRSDRMLLTWVPWLAFALVMISYSYMVFAVVNWQAPDDYGPAPHAEIIFYFSPPELSPLP